MPRETVVGRFYALPTSREFELHPVAAPVISGRIAADMPVADLFPFNGTGKLCSCIVGGNPPTLLAIGPAKQQVLQSTRRVL